jgi:YjbE family integral membrane protein
MDIFSTQFLYALGAIILIDLVLAGDNAIVIALAARNLPDHLRKRAILWGTAGAIFVRALMTMAVVWLLKIPGLLAIGGVALVWIAVKLLAPKEEEGEGHVAATSFFGAMKTIVIADAVMGLDNVLAVAGAAHGSFLLVVLGLLISIPIVVWGSNLVLKLIDKYPVIIFGGAAVLGWTAAKMIWSEPVLKPYLPESTVLAWLFYAAVVGFVLGLGHLLARRSKAAAGSAAPATSHDTAKDDTAAKATEVTEVSTAAAPVVAVPQAHAIPAPFGPLLVPVDGSRSARVAVEHALRSAPRDAQGNLVTDLHLVHVVPKMNRHISRFVPAAARNAFTAERNGKALQPMVERLQSAGVPVKVHLVSARDAAVAIADAAKVVGASKIVMASRSSSGWARLGSGSLTDRVLGQATVPVEVLAAGERPLWQKLSIPVGLGVLFTALALD